MSEYDVPTEKGVLRPLADTPPRELEVWHNANLRASLARGLSQSAAGETHDLGSFAQYVDAGEAVECIHCAAEVLPDGNDDWVHAARNGGRGLYRCQSTDVTYGHLAHPEGVPCRADGPNPCLGAGR